MFYKKVICCIVWCARIWQALMISQNCWRALMEGRFYLFICIFHFSLSGYLNIFTEKFAFIVRCAYASFFFMLKFKKWSLKKKQCVFDYELSYFMHILWIVYKSWIEYSSDVFRPFFFFYLALLYAHGQEK